MIGMSRHRVIFCGLLAVLFMMGATGVGAPEGGDASKPAGNESIMMGWFGWAKKLDDHLKPHYPSTAEPGSMRVQIMGPRWDYWDLCHAVPRVLPIVTAIFGIAAVVRLSWYWQAIRKEVQKVRQTWAVLPFVGAEATGSICS